VASAALAVVAAPLAGAIGNESPGRALAALVTGGAVGGAVYVAVLMALRADEPGALLAIVRRRRVPVPDV
jgi:hypothetical protein